MPTSADQMSSSKASSSCGKEEIIDNDVHVYKRRWYVLALYCFYCGFQAAIWNTFSPITYAVQLAYDWSDATMALLANWGPIAYVTLTIPFTYLFDKWGARYCVLFGTLLVAVGTALRTFTTEDPAFITLCHIGQFLNGASGIIVMSFPAMISSIWFPDKERILATALSQSINILGVAIAAGIGPLCVPYDETYDEVEAPESEIDATIHNLHIYLIVEAVIAAVLFLCVLAYFPEHPLKPPSTSSVEGLSEQDFTSSWAVILKNRDAWLTCLAMAIPGGLTMGWQGVMAIQLEPLGVTDTEVGNVGFVAFFGQAAATLVVGLTMDHFRNKIKLSLLVMLTTSCACFTWLALLTLELIPYSLGQLYAAMVIGTGTYFACFPLFFEMEIMICKEASEGTIGAFLTGLYNVFMLIFLLIMMIPDIDVTWMNYLLIAGTAAAIPLMAIVRKPKDYVSQEQ